MRAREYLRCVLSIYSQHSLTQANYYIAFAILTKALEDESLTSASTVDVLKVLNIILNYFYVGLLVMCFILSLGNRLQGSKGVRAIAHDHVVHPISPRGALLRRRAQRLRRTPPLPLYNNKVEVAIPTMKNDINALYEGAIHVLNTRPPKVEQMRDAMTVQEDYCRGFRTK
ncbi:hypothetical protein H0H87_007454 [Tephrocybe sp. NHM501043]|nr:hypothetical protein H0H87_007454 [Tephrocybe sp. NHM501043]